MSRDACIELAQALGIDISAALEHWGERAAIREFEGGLSREDAERAALDDLRALHRKGPRSAASSPHDVAKKQTK